MDRRWVSGGWDDKKMQNMYRPRILTENARFPPFGVDIAETSTKSKETPIGPGFPLFRFDVGEANSYPIEDIRNFQNKMNDL